MEEPVPWDVPAPPGETTVPAFPAPGPFPEDVWDVPSPPGPTRVTEAASRFLPLGEMDAWGPSRLTDTSVEADPGPLWEALPPWDPLVWEDAPPDWLPPLPWAPGPVTRS